jgi:hypothetical protein
LKWIASLSRFIIFLVALGSLPIVAQKSAIAGADDPEFQTLVDLWLDGKDKVALDGMADLANDSHLAAQLFLGVITNGVANHTSSRLLLRLPQSQRNHITRLANGPHAGKPWLMAAREHHPLAQAYLDYKDQWKYKPAFDQLFTHNEWFLAYDAHVAYMNLGGLNTVLRGADRSHYDVVSKPWVAPFVQRAAQLGLPKPSAKLLAEYAKVGDANYGTEHEFYYWGRSEDTHIDPQTKRAENYPRVILRRPALHNRLRGYVVHDPRMAPVRQLCDQICPNSSSSCGIALRAHMRSYDKFWNKSRSPINALVGTARYRKSVRFPRDMRALLSLEPTTPSAVAPLSVCFSDFMYGH